MASQSSGSLLQGITYGGYPPINTQVSPAYRYFTHFQTTQFWQLTVEPFHRRVIVPLGLGDYLLICIGIAASYAIKKTVCKYQNFYAKPLGILGSACCLGIIYQIVNAHINQHFNGIARTSLQHLRGLVENATAQNTQELSRQVEALQGAEFNHLVFDSSLATLLVSATTFIKELKNRDLEQGTLENQRQALLADIDAITIP